MQKEHEFDKKCTSFPVVGGTDIHSPGNLNSDAHMHYFQDNHLKTFSALRCEEFLQTNLLLDDTERKARGKTELFSLEMRRITQDKFAVGWQYEREAGGKRNLFSMH